MPSKADLDLARIKRLLPCVLLIDVERSPLDFRFRLVGTEVDRILSAPYTGMRFSQLPHMREGSGIWGHFAQVAGSGAPLCSEIGYVGPDARVQRVTHALFPLSRDGRAVDLIWTVLDIRRRP